MPEKLDAELLYHIHAELGAPQVIGDTQYGRRGILPVTGGHFEGPKMRGTILPPGGEWGLTRIDGVGRLDVRMTLKTEDDALIYVTYTGVFDGDPAVTARALSTGDVDEGEYYLRITPYFETGYDKYKWLNRVVAVGYGHLVPNSAIEYRIYKIL